MILSHFGVKYPAMPIVTLLRNFKQDNRTSMELYADKLLNQIPDIASHNYVYRAYRPQRHSWLADNAGVWSMRHARYFEYPGQVKQLKSDIYHISEHGYAHLVNQLPADKTIVTVHDVIPYLRWKRLIPGVDSGRRPWFSEYALRQLKKAAKIITISENTKRDLITHFGCSAKQIQVIYPGLDQRPIDNLPNKSTARTQLGITDTTSKLVLVCGQDFYKNLETSVDVFKRLAIKHKNLKLVHLGRNTPYWHQIKKSLNSEHQVYEFSDVSDYQVYLIYRAVDCLLFPSVYEGFGLPPIEAMACATPVVTSDRGSLPEATATAALVAGADNPQRLSELVEMAIYDEDSKNKLIDQGLKHAQNFSWKHTAEQTHLVYKQLLAQTLIPN